MLKAYLYDDKGYFTHETDCQLDPLESEKAGKDIFLTPGSATLTKPLKAKKGFKIKFDAKKEKWVYEQEPEKEEQKPYEPTEKEKLEMEIGQTKYELSQLDYIGVKIATGRATKEQYAEEIAKMDELANKINELQQKLEKLN